MLVVLSVPVTKATRLHLAAWTERHWVHPLFNFILQSWVAGELANARLLLAMQNKGKSISFFSSKLCFPALPTLLSDFEFPSDALTMQPTDSETRLHIYKHTFIYIVRTYITLYLIFIFIQILKLDIFKVIIFNTVNFASLVTVVSYLWWIKYSL